MRTPRRFRLLRSLTIILVAAGIISAGVLVALRITRPALIWAAETKLIEFITEKSHEYPVLSALLPRPVTVSAQEMPFPPWKPYPAGTTAPSKIRIGERYFENLPHAASALRDGDSLVIGEGVYEQALVIKADNVTLVGDGHVVLDGQAARGKGAILIDGHNVTVRNIECRNIEVPDQNGACIRQQGKNLTVEHVYFRDSQQGILTGHAPGHTQISDSRFENLGYGGRAHGIYIGGGSLNIENSWFLRSKGQGHEIKSRSETTRIVNTVIASLDGEDSRLIDLPQGGDITIERCILEQGPNSSNYNMLGIGLEGRHHPRQKLVLRDNIIILERKLGNLLFHIADGIPAPTAWGDLIIGGDDPEIAGHYIYYKSREAMGLKPFPFIPKPLDASSEPDKTR